MTLKAERCEACKSDSPLVTDAEERQLKPQVADWEIVTVNNVRRLKKTFEFDGWMPAVAFANDVARIADEDYPHPVGQGDRHLVDPRHQGVASQRFHHGRKNRRADYRKVTR
jgi:hypothetical protein